MPKSTLERGIYVVAARNADVFKAPTALVKRACQNFELKY